MWSWVRTRKCCAPRLDGREPGARRRGESESDRTVLEFHGPQGEAATVIVLRKRGQVWLVLNGAPRTTVAMNEPDAHRLIEAVRTASRGG